MFFKKDNQKQEELILEAMPKHVAIIMDGNGRWAKKKKVPISFGHSQGVKRIEDVLNVADEVGIEAVTIYAFSTENWKRDEAEVSHLMKLVGVFYETDFFKFKRNNVKLRVVGSSKNVPQNVLDLFNKMEIESKDNTGVVLNIAFNYGSRMEITESVNKFIKNNPNKEITEKDILDNLYEGINEDIDLIIRTSGEQRLSNFVLWQACYSEFVFSDELWPDFNKSEFKKCLLTYQKRNRRFGGR